MSDRYHQISKGGLFVPKGMGYDVVLPWNVNKRKMAFFTTWTTPVDEDRLIGSWDLLRLRIESWNAYRNRPLARAIVDRICQSVVSTTSLMPSPQTSSDKWNDAATEWFASWGRVADYRRRFPSLAAMDWAVILHVILDGEFFVAQMPDGRELPIEAERITTPAWKTDDKSCVMGAQLNDRGEVVGWWVAERTSSGGIDNTRCEFFEARNMMHIRLPARNDSIHGIPYLAPVLANLIDLDEYRENIRLKTKHEAKRSMQIRSNAPFDPSADQQRFTGYRAEGETTATKPVLFENINELEIYRTGTDEFIESLEMKNPGSQHAEFIASESENICAGVGVSLEWVLNAYKSSYIASRAALVTTSNTIERFQFTLEESKKKREWNWRIAKAINAGELPPAPVDSRKISEWYKVFWHWPRMLVLDRQKEANADAREYANRTKSLTALTREAGNGDFLKNVLPELVKEARAMMTAAGYPDNTPIPLPMLSPIIPGAPQNAAPEDNDDDQSPSAKAAQKAA